jgi:hypothetical protein
MVPLITVRISSQLCIVRLVYTILHCVSDMCRHIQHDLQFFLMIDSEEQRSCMKLYPKLGKRASEICDILQIVLQKIFDQV